MTDATTAARFRTRLFWQVLGGLVIAAGLLLLLFWRVNFTDLRHALSAISVPHIVAACAFHAAAVVFRSLRWRRLGVAHQRATALDCLSANANGMLVGLAFPGLNEFTRAYVLKRRAQAPFGAVLGVLMAERLLDMLLLLIAVFLVLLLVPGVEWGALSRAVLIVAGALAVALVGVFVLTQRRSAGVVERLLARGSGRFVGRVAGFIGNFSDALRRLRELRAGQIVEIAALSVLLWASNALFAYLVFLGFGSRLALGIEAALLTVALIYFGLIIRLTPAGFGQYHLVVYIALGAFGVGGDTAVSVALVLHSVMLVVTIALGVPFVYREHIGLSRLASEKAASAQDPAASSHGSAPPGSGVRD